ncbi:AAA domain-containing protein [Actinobacillus arthritidis]|uniref:AAA domain-containing protein n=1 Tax=Actinobacillus arthritidis TaxID=157339 RepID=UPI0024421C77|nr:AAA domain-containing protein [Actinobacillus arthritidis]WGE89474.1 AAA domain-containing protein [Actinobacillus arthritidis]
MKLLYLNTCMLTNAQLAILDFWHKIEFFLPFDLQRELLDNSSIPYKTAFCTNELQQLSPEQIWTIPDLKADEEPLSYAVFLGIYDKNELSQQLERIIGTQDYHSLNERLQSIKPSASCVAKIRLNEKGGLDYNSIKVDLSTTPWAISKIKQVGLDSLSFESFEQDLNQLQQEIKNFALEKLNQEENDSAPLTGKDLLTLYEILVAWVDFKSENTALPLIYIQKNKGKKKDKSNKQKANRQEAKSFSEEKDIEVDISILNSFYAKDIADVIRSHKQQVSPVLNSYLSTTSRKIDLYHQGISIILEHLQPKYFNSGRWLENSQYNMSLMQQFAINTIFKQQDEQVLFSVNGPPGTGKTTLLKEIFAENIVRRAEKLSEYKTVRNSFKKTPLKIEFNKQTLYVYPLQDDLTGFEMVVTSSNNAAVQNISKELPQIKSLGKEEWRDEVGHPTFTYLQPIAQNIISYQEKNDKASYSELPIEQSPWGLISCSLGNSKNRRAFVNSFMNANPDAKGYDPIRHQGIMQWKNNQNILSFTQAKKIFVAKNKQVKKRIIQLQKYAESLEVKDRGDFERLLQSLQLQQQKMISELEVNHTDLVKNQQKLTACKQLIENLKEQKALLYAETNVNWLIKFFKKEKLANKRQDLTQLLEQEKQYLSEQKCLINDISMIESECKSQEQKIEQLKLEIINLNEKKRECEDNLASLSKQFSQVEFTFDKKALNEDSWQIKSLWNDPQLNLLRSELFQSALQLHEAWLKDALTMEKGISHNIFAINNLLSGQAYLVGNKLAQEEATKIIWQTLFMIVPVVSTTFASFRSQFRHLQANSLGWVFVDEAGQAVPQAAVGALWRAKRAVIVGDPLQIEPVFTTPVDFTERLAETSYLPLEFNVKPHQTSVQLLADKANPFGTEISGLWVGSPLRVHRRCCEPMFSIANIIAYEGKMIYGNGKHKFPPQSSLDLGKSAWINITPNETVTNQREREIAFVKKLLLRLMYRLQDVPPVYIITPFRKLKEELQCEIRKLKQWEQIKVSGYEWVKENVGTVHTFQGKENQIVLFVLGCDEQNIQSATALVSKPNLINVAATRAKHRFFIVGNHQLWTAQYPLFAQTFSLLDNQLVSAEQIFEQAEKLIQE